MVMTLKKFFGLVTIVGILGMLVTGYLAYASYIKLEQARAIESAKDYKSKPYDMCNSGVQITVDAIHVKTGAKYTFPNRCMPSGWKADK
jgi:uncharacterized membrane protein YukC